MHLLDLMEPEETVGNLWHEMASQIGADVTYCEAGVSLSSVRQSLAVLFRALGGASGVELVEAAPTLAAHRRTMRRKLGVERDREWVASFDGERLSLPPFIANFADPTLNRAAYFWLTALAATTDLNKVMLPDVGACAAAFDCAQIKANADAVDAAYAACPGLRDSYSILAPLCADTRPSVIRPPYEAAIESAIRNQLNGSCESPDYKPAMRGYMSFAPVPIWLRFGAPGSGV
jgi:nitric oxide reductase NorD protein